MPEMNGYEATSIIRNDLKNNTPIIAMTAHAMAGEREKCLALGMNDYIPKPINADHLFEKMLHQWSIAPSMVRLLLLPGRLDSRYPDTRQNAKKSL